MHRNKCIEIKTHRNIKIKNKYAEIKNCCRSSRHKPDVLQQFINSIW